MTLVSVAPDADESSPNTSVPHIRPHSWLVLESGMPRLMPIYFAAYCWNRSPTTQMNPPASNQNITGFAAASCSESGANPPL